MKNNFIENINDEKYFYSLIEDLENSKVGFYSVGLYPASLAYNCAMHGKSNNILLAPREDRDLLGAFSKDVLSDMDNEIIEKIKNRLTDFFIVFGRVPLFYYFLHIFDESKIILISDIFYPSLNYDLF